jgi:hypothetical protein
LRYQLAGEKGKAVKIKTVVLAVLLVSMIVATISAVSAAIPPDNDKRSDHARVPDVYELTPDQAKNGLDIAASHVPDAVPRMHAMPD